MPTVNKTTLKRFNGTEWEAIHLATSGDITRVGEDIIVMGSSIGALNVGDVVKGTDSITQTLKMMLQTRIPATYSAPSVAISVASGTAKGNYEAGSVISASIRSVFTKNDAGTLTSHVIKKNGENVVTGTDITATYAYSTTLGDEFVTFTSVAAYDAGAIKTDNLGTESPNGAIPAGTKTGSGVSYTGIRKYFYGPDSAGVGAAITTSAGIRALTASSGAALKGATFSISVPAGSTRCTIAFRSNIGTLAQVLYRESGNANITSQFSKTTASVEGANGYTEAEYNVYTVTWAQPTAGAMTFDVKI